MPDVKISALPAATVALAGTEVLPIVQSATTRQVSVANLTAGRAINALSLTASSLTSGRVTYAGTAGLLQDSASLTFDGTTVTTPRLAFGGTTLPSAGTATLFSRSSDNNTYLQTGSGSNVIFLDSSQNTMVTFAPTLLTFLISGAEKMRLDSSGKFIVNATTPVDTTMIGTVYDGLNANGIGVNDATGASGSGLIKFLTLGTVRGSITNNANTGVLYNVTSDQRLKTNIVNAPIGNIDNIKVRSFDWIADGSHQEYGMVAQELIEVAPYAVNKPENPDEMMGVDYSKLVPMMIKEIQDLKQRITALENK